MLMIDHGVSCVSGCAISECVHNDAEQCRTPTLSVGDGFRPQCLNYRRKVGVFPALQVSHQIRAVVGACSVVPCAHNEDFECRADRIKIGEIGGHGSCVSFVERRSGPRTSA
jgi:Domain of Unknown Function (DUF1540)